MKNFEEKTMKDLSSIIGGANEGLVIKMTEHMNDDGSTIVKLDIFWRKKRLKKTGIYLKTK